MSSPAVAIAPLVQPPDTSVVVPGSKSHTNRALLCAALATGRSTLHGALKAEDTEAMSVALRSLGVEVFEQDQGETAVIGTGGRLLPGPLELDVNQSGTTCRFVLPMLTLCKGPYRLDGHEQLRSRPLGTLIDALAALGAEIDGSQLPITVSGGRTHGGHVSLPGSASSQFLSGLLLSAPLMSRAGQSTSASPSSQSGPISIEVQGDLVSKPYVDLTLATMATFGVHVARDGYQSFTVEPQAYQAALCEIEPDASAASYFFAAAAITGGRVRVEGLNAATVQGDLAFVAALERMGAQVVRGDDWTEVVGPSRLTGIDIDMADISDTAQTLAIVATFAHSPTTISGVGFIRRKETDRLAAVATELSRLGIRATELTDGLKVWPGKPHPGLVDTYDDHRMAMSFALLGLRHAGVRIGNPGCVRKTFPEFFQTLDQLR